MVDDEWGEKIERIKWAAAGDTVNVKIEAALRFGKKKN